MMHSFCVLAFCAANYKRDSSKYFTLANLQLQAFLHPSPTSAEMMRGFCVLAFCAANYKRGLCNATNGADLPTLAQK
jgi:hypothetical protein